MCSSDPHEDLVAASLNLLVLFYSGFMFFLQNWVVSREALGFVFMDGL